MYYKDVLLLVPHVAFFVLRLRAATHAVVGDDQGTVFNIGSTDLPEGLCEMRMARYGKKKMYVGKPDGMRYHAKKNCKMNRKCGNYDTKQMACVCSTTPDRACATEKNIWSRTINLRAFLIPGTRDRARNRSLLVQPLEKALEKHL